MNEKDRPKGVAGMLPQELYSRASIRSEKELQNMIANELLRRGIYFVRQRMDKKAGLKVGTPDFLICLNGRFIGLEVKVGAEHPTAEQQGELERIRQSGGLAFVVRSLDEVRTILEKEAK